MRPSLPFRLAARRAGRRPGAQPAGTSRVRPVLTPRALVLGALVVLLVVVLASPLHRYLGSRSDVTHAARQLHDDQQALLRLSTEKQRWSDPGYVQQQARRRLEYAMPGDTVYTVVGPHGGSDLGERNRPAGGPPAGQAWTNRLWRSVEAASGD